MDTKWQWNSPLTQAALAWIGVTLSVLSVLPFAKLIEPVLAILRQVPLPSPPQWQSFAWLILFVVLIMLAALAWSAFNIVRKRQVRPLDRLGLLPAAWGRDGRLGLARLTGTCPACGASMRLKNVATLFKTDQNGKEYPAKWEPFVVCRDNPEQHRFPFDMTATVDDGSEASGA